MSPKLRLPLFAAFCGVAFATSHAFAADSVKLTQGEKSVRVEIGGKLFTEYHFKDVPKPFCYPVIGPGGQEMTRNWPMKDVPGEEHDHPHHQSLWFGHFNVNSNDFWGVGPKSGKMVHERFIEVKSGAKVGVVSTQNKWVSVDGRTFLQDERTLRFHANHMLDFEITMKATDGDVTFGDDKDGVMAIRLAESMRLTKPRPKGQKKSETGEGHIVMSTGVRDNETWGKRAAWCDYYGPVDGKTVGVAIFDHPGNPRFPTWWHVRDYGLFAANPFGKHHFENLKDDKSAGNFTLANGKSVTFRYRFVFHEGDEAQAKLAEKYAEWAK